jgi:hypothetical protein
MHGLLELALTYPYQRPSSSFVLHQGTVTEDFLDFDKSNRTPVIACGSNAAPSQLLRKFPDTSDKIFVSTAELLDFACVYSPHITAYGSIPATLAHIPGHRTSCHITWLTELQLQTMHQTEAIGLNYRFSKLSNLRLQCESIRNINTAFAYISIHGGLLIDGTLVELTELSPPAAPQSIPQLTQKGIQEAAIHALNEDISLEEFVLGNINNKLLRQKRTQNLNKISCAFNYPNEEIIMDQL